MTKSHKSNNSSDIENVKENIHLSKLETTVLNGICRGLSSNDLAKDIHKSPRTVDDYRKSLYINFDVHNKEQLIAKAVAMKIVHLSDIIS